MVLSLSNYNDPDCSEPLDRANTAEQELGHLVDELRQYIHLARNNKPFAAPTVEDVLSGIEEIIRGD